MKNKLKIVTVMSLLFLFTKQSEAQNYFHGSIGKGTDTNQVNIYFMPNYNSVAGEYALGTDFAVTVPTRPGSNATFVPNPSGLYAGLPFTSSVENPYPTETLFGFHNINNGITMPPWTTGTQYLIGTITFTGVTGPLFGDSVRMVDKTNDPSYNNGYFDVAMNTGDKTDYSNYFYVSSGSSVIQTDVNGDKFITAAALRLLPVKLINFTAIKSNNFCSVNIDWQVAQELSLKGYTVERSQSDNRNKFSSIAFVNASGKSNYAFSDSTPAPGLNYYRLKMVDIDGKFTYSQIIPVNSTCGIEGNISVFPNPVTGVANVYGLTGKNKIAIIDAAGRQVASYINSRSTQKINFGGFAKGIYTVQVAAADGTTTSIKVVKQ